MDSSKDLSFPPASEVPLHRIAPLAPTQELAYRKKCIQLKRRLAEIEANNDATRKRIIQETEHVQKMRILRAILLNHLNEIMSAPAKKLTPEQLEKIGVLANGSGNVAELAGSGISKDLIPTRPQGEGLLDDSSEESEEDEPEPLERPERRRRANNTYRETIMNTNTPSESLSTMYQQTALPNLAPATSFSVAPHDPAMLTSSFRVSSTTPQAVGSQGAQHQHGGDSRYAQSSPIAVNQHLGMPYQGPNQTRATSISSNNVDANGLGRSPAVNMRPERPEPPYVQFTMHMRPQLEADNYPPEQIPGRIQSEWDGLSAENRKLWDDRYQDQMREYTAAMDAYKRATRREGSGGGFASINS
ncbi:uncharacterized protein Z518_03849 [Rhinocladiella mackenziei CBS 650.93]|uniref:Rhinocladiella mackenziei CBS 650.93 unplaced genomic scaffold supercont1.3, whole genome shotgun sequence n=1 Tax=Rhinocladiella mackenziei CBS 650.93 TaxID=1442369 RepID=A0A0D2IRW1_9EURO|nr:uncharacterized protein Z518_03849 [Rhinocladiella mackenziei CBS 650.93]KIX05876.1 hypothetical protein Z518_03849 [Rhinocladiella mackenziei CBS 650.93]